MEKTCEVCGASFEGRVDATVCGSTCRSRRLRTSVATDIGEVLQSATDNPLSVATAPSDATDKLPLKYRMTPVAAVSFFPAKELGINFEKDLGVTGWDSNGIFISPDITTKQVRAIRSLVMAKRGVKDRVLYPVGA